MIGNWLKILNMQLIIRGEEKMTILKNYLIIYGIKMFQSTKSDSIASSFRPQKNCCVFLTLLGNFVLLSPL